MTEWSALFEKNLDGMLAGMDKNAFLERFGWVREYADTAASLLSPEALSTMPPAEIYARLDSLNVPKCQIRMTNLGRMNQAEEVVEGVKRLLQHPGDFAGKYRAGKIPQAGVVTLTQILCLARPGRFAIRNAPFTRALAKQIPFYSPKALDELGYEEFLDLCRELARTLEKRLAPLGLGNWAEELRFLLLYAVLVE